MDAGPGNVGRSISPFGDRSIPQALGGDSMGLKPIELLDDLFPCGYAYACEIDLSEDPPKPDYSNMFLVKDFFGLSGYAGWQGWADSVARKMSGSDSDSSGEEVFYPLVNIGPLCEEGSSSSWSASESEESSLSEESSSSASSESSSSSSSSACPGGMYWVPIQDCSADSGNSGSGNITGWQMVYIPPGTCPDDSWQPATFPRGGPTPPAV